MSQRRYAFIVRLWQEGASAVGSSLRGSLQAVDSEKVHYFSSLDEISALLRQITRAPWHRSRQENNPQSPTETQVDRKVT